MRQKKKQNIRNGRIVALCMSVCLSLAILLTSVLPAAAAGSTTSKIKIACVGASTTVGVGSGNGGYPAALQKLLGDDYEVRNFGKNSTTALKNGRDNENDTPGSCAYYGSDVHTSSLSYMADIVLIMIGANDTKPANWNDGNNNFEADYKSLVESYLNQGNNPKVFIVTDAWVQKTNWGINDETLIGSVIPTERKIAEELGLTVIDNYSATKNQDSYYTTDGIHMNDTGYAKAAELIAETVKAEGGKPAEIFSIDPPRDGQDYNFGNSRGEFDGYSVIQWLNGTKGWFKYDNGMLASSLGLENGTIVDDMTMTISYYYENQAGNDDDLIRSVTYDQNNNVAPSPDGTGDRGAGYMIKDDSNSFHMVSGEWADLVISRQNQKLGNTPWDWYFEVERMNEANSLYVRGYEISVTLADGTVKKGIWGTLTGEADVVDSLNPPRVPEDYNMQNPTGTFDGYDVIHWLNGTKAWFKYDNGTLAAALGIESGTVVDDLTFTISYYYDNQTGDNNNDKIRCVTYNQNNVSAPSPSGVNGMNGEGYMVKEDPDSYHMKSGEWANLVISNKNQMLGGSVPWDWYFEVYAMDDANSLYVRGYEVAVTLADGTTKRVQWGVVDQSGTEPEDPEKPEVPEVYEPVTDYSNYDSIKIACIGASTTDGTDGYHYPTFLQTMLGGRFEVRNFGYPGSCVLKNQQYSYIGSQKYNDSLAFGADIVIIDIGTNDTQPQYWNGGNNQVAEGYEELVNAYRSQENKPLILLSLGNRIVKPSWGIDEAVVVNDIMPMQKAVAEKYNLLTANLHDSFLGHEDEYIVDDGVHYTKAGYLAMAQLYYDTLMEVITVPEDSQDMLWNPTSVSFNDIYGEYDGYKVLQWVNGKTGYFSYDSGSLGAALGIEDGTVVKNLSIDVSYFWDYHTGGNDWMHFNTNDKDGLSAPSINGNPHDNGFGLFSGYGMKQGEWDILTVSRDEQMLGAPNAADWYLNVGSLDSSNSLYIRGYQITAELEDGTTKTVLWGTLGEGDEPDIPPIVPDTTELEAQIKAAEEMLSSGKLENQSDEVKASFEAALEAAKGILENSDAEQTEIDHAVDVLKTAIANVKDVPDDGKDDPDDGKDDPDDGKDNPDDGKDNPDDGKDNPDDGKQNPGNDNQNSSGQTKNPSSSGQQTTSGIKKIVKTIKTGDNAALFATAAVMVAALAIAAVLGIQLKRRTK